jgi:hypothetical protein
MELGALILGAYKLIIVISFCSIFPFISMDCPSSSHLINIGLKSTLSKKVLLPLHVFRSHWLGLLPAFHRQPVLVSVDEMGLL